MPLPEDTVSVSQTVFDLLVEAGTTANVQARDRLLAQALVRSCDYLQRLDLERLSVRYDGIIGQSDEFAKAMPRLHATGALALVSQDPNHFCQFLDREADLLIQAGMSQSVVKWLIARIRARACECALASADGRELVKALTLLQVHVCAQRDMLLRRMDHRQTAEVLLLCLGGLSIIAVDVSCTVLSPIGVGASCTIGAGLVSDGVKKLMAEA